MVKASVTLGTIDFVHEVLNECNITQKLFDVPLTVSFHPTYYIFWSRLKPLNREDTCMSTAQVKHD